jgi:D-alanine-D-alanine ligase
VRTVAVLFGGRSLEHDVSVVSGLQVLHALDPDGCQPLPIYIDEWNRWWIGDDLWHRQAFQGGGPDRSRLSEVTLAPGFGTSTLLRASASPLREWLTAGSRFLREVLARNVPAAPGLGGGAIPVDVFVPVLHGTFGEDGCVQGLLEQRGCAYVGCGVLASAVGMNKRVTKVVAAQAGVPIVPWLSCDRGAVDSDRTWLRKLPARVARNFGWPVIVKPCNLGSSAGVSVAATPDELIAGVLNVFEYDVEALIEPFIKNRLELNVAVAGLEEPVPSITEMPVTHQQSPLTFGEKYKRQGRKSVGTTEGMPGALRVLDPQDLPAEMRARAQELATTVFALLGCEGISRIDFLIDADKNELYFNEINTLPGSFSYYLWSAAPHYWTLTELLAKLIARAERLRAMKRGLQRRPPPDLRLLG